MTHKHNSPAITLNTLTTNTLNNTLTINMKKLFTFLFFAIFTILSLQAQQPATSVTTSTRVATPTSVGSESWGNGNDVYLETMTVGGKVYEIEDVANIYRFKREDNTLATGERERVFVEKINSNSSTVSYRASYPADANGDCSMIEALRSPIINRGALDIFHNVNSSNTQHANNIERLDAIFGSTIKTPALTTDAGFLATEKSGNNEFQAAAILSLDANGEPASYGPLVYIDGTTNDYGRLNSSYKWKFMEEPVGGNGIPVSYANTSEKVGFTLITFQDLGLTAGTVFYGISYFGKDVNTTDHDLLQPSTFPKNTNEGADIHGGLGALFTTNQVTVEELLYKENGVIAENDVNTTPEDVPVSGNILTNDIDLEADAFSIQSISGLNAAGASINIPTDGTVVTIFDAAGTEAGTISFQANGDYTFTPATGCIGTVPVNYTIVDANSTPATDVATLNIQVLPTLETLGTNNAPIATNDTNTSEQGATTTNKILVNDIDVDGNSISVSTVTALDATGVAITLTTNLMEVYDANGNLAGEAKLDANGNVVFTALLTYKGAVPFDYSITDGAGGTDDATLTINVIETLPGDNNTFANDDINIGEQDIAQTGNTSINDADLQGEQQAISSAKASDNSLITLGLSSELPSGGTITLNSNGTYVYNPADGFVGTELVEYTICDNASPSACEKATLYLTTLARDAQLPVELIYFNAVHDECTNYLTWETASEENNSHFVIQYSTDGVTFKNLDKVMGEGFSTVNVKYSYTHTDLNLNAYYYRLMQVDFDDKFEYSDILFLAGNCAASYSFSKTDIYPNPTVNFVNARIVNNRDSERDVIIMVIDNLGRVVSQQQSTLTFGENIERVEMRDLAAGMYHISVDFGNGDRETVSIIKR